MPDAGHDTTYKAGHPGCNEYHGPNHIQDEVFQCFVFLLVVASRTGKRRWSLWLATIDRHTRGFRPHLLHVGAIMMKVRSLMRGGVGPTSCMLVDNSAAVHNQKLCCRIRADLAACRLRRCSRSCTCLQKSSCMHPWSTREGNWRGPQPRR